MNQDLENDLNFDRLKVSDMKSGMVEIGGKNVIHNTEIKITRITVLKWIGIVVASTAFLIILLNSQSHISSRNEEQALKGTASQTQRDNSNNEIVDRPRSTHRR